MGVLKPLLAIPFITTMVLAGLEDQLRAPAFDGKVYSPIGQQMYGYAPQSSPKVGATISARLKPFTVDTPPVRNGCGAIDLLYGAMPYMKVDAMVAKMQKTASAAPAFVFNMALSSLCKDCQTVLSELEAITDTLNQVNFASCQAATQWAKPAGEWLYHHMLNSDDPKHSLDAWNWGGTQGVRDTFKKIAERSGIVQTYTDGTTFTEAETVKQAKAVEKKHMQGSLLSKVWRDNPTLIEAIRGQGTTGEYSSWFSGLSTSDAEGLMRNLVGDIYGYVASPEECSSYRQDGTLSSYSLAMIYPGLSPQEFVSLLLGDGVNTAPVGGEFKGVFIERETPLGNCGPGYKGKPHAPVSKAIASNFGAKELRGEVAKNIKNSYKMLKDKQEGFVGSLGFANTVPYPVYQALNVAYDTQDETLLEHVIDYVVAREVEGVTALWAGRLRELAGAISLTDTVGSDPSVPIYQQRILKVAQEITSLSKHLAQDILDRMNVRLEHAKKLDEIIKRSRIEMVRQGLMRDVR